MKTKISILIPCYNESKTIEKVINECKKYLPDATIYVYDNNSNDGTDKIAKKNGVNVRYVREQGKGNVVRQMFKEIDSDCYLMIDGDNTYSLENSRKMINLVLNEKYDMVIGDRLSSNYFEVNTRRYHNIGNKIIRNLVNKFYKSKINDVCSGYRVFSNVFVKKFPCVTKKFEIETEMTIYAIKNKLKIKEINVLYQDREEGSYSKLNTFKDGIRIIYFIMKCYFFKNYN